MTAPKTTPGPWRTGTKAYRTIYDAENRLIGLMDRAEDATLVAAAPDLLEALEVLLAIATPEAIEAARSAVARARGGQ